MIYLIQTDYFNPESPETPISLLKIGYTSKENLESRMNCYKVCNPRHKLLCLVEGEETEEQRLHQKFIDSRYPDYGKEWFIFSQDIVDFVSSGKFEDLELTAPEKTRQSQDQIITDLAKVYGIELKGINHETLGKIKTKEAALRKLKSMFPEKFYNTGIE